ncbi:MAG: hypothetical protein NT162_01265 [Candidatus Woesebacteria bacterium]|nr:hypothetical protein [Candidatus Woesebacteria bacterium]
MNTRRSPLLVLVAALGLLPMSAYLTIQYWWMTIFGGNPLTINGEDFLVIEWALRILPWAMVLFAYPFVTWTEGNRLSRIWISTLLLAALNVTLYFSAFPGFGFLTWMGQALTIMIISTIDFWAVLLYVFRQQ